MSAPSGRLRSLALPGTVLALGGAAALGWWIGSGRASGELLEARALESRYDGALDAASKQRLQRPDLDDALDAFVERTLGGDRESVDAALRSRLFALAEACGLREVSVTTTSNRGVETPARREFAASGQQRALRDELDFVEVGATIAGNGTDDAVLRLLASLRADPVLHRVVSFRIDPKGDGTNAATSVRLVTIYLPGERPEASPPPVTPTDGVLAAAIAREGFRVPPVPVAPPPVVVTQPEPVAPPPPPPPPPPFPYHEWMITGIVELPEGASVYLLHTPSGDRRELTPGGTLEAVVFVELSAAGAVFTRDEQRFERAVGDRLPRARAERGG